MKRASETTSVEATTWGSVTESGKHGAPNPSCALLQKNKALVLSFRMYTLVVRAVVAHAHRAKLATCFADVVLALSARLEIESRYCAPATAGHYPLFRNRCVARAAHEQSHAASGAHGAHAHVTPLPRIRVVVQAHLAEDRTPRAHLLF